MTFLEWRKFNFFDLRKNVDNGKVAEVLQDTTIEVCTSGYSHLIIGDGKGWIHKFSRSWQVTSFKAYEHAIFHALQLKHDPLLITIGEDETGIKSVIKVWDGSRQDSHGRLACLRVTKMPRIRSSPTALTVHDNKNLMAIGFDDGLVSLFRGNIARQRSSKEIELRNRPTEMTSITGLAFKGTSHLFVACQTSVIVFFLNNTGKEHGVIIDEKFNNRCENRPNCAMLVQDQQFVVARNDAIYCYTTDGRGPCYVLAGVKKRIDWFRNYLVTISKGGDIPKVQSNEESSAGDEVTIFDIQNKFIVSSLPLDKVKAVSTEWGAFYIITEDKQIYHLDEKDIQSKLSLLFKKNLYDFAIRIASSQKFDSDRLIDIYTQYGDHLFKKGESKSAIEQYIKTIGKLETSYVIRKYLKARHLEPLTLYLQELHKLGLATEDHTTLLLTCFVKLDQHDQHGKLKEFINATDRVIDFDVEIAIKVCRQVSSDDALHLAKKHSQHNWYLRIVIEDKKDYNLALDYISDLEFEDANFYMKKHGNILMQHIPAETTQFLKRLCIDYKPKNKPLVNDDMMADVIFRNSDDKARPEEYIHLFLNNSERLVEFIEHLVNCEGNWSTLIYNTLIEHHLHVWSTLKDKQGAREVYEQKIVRLLQNPDTNYDKDQTLIVCLMLNFKPGILYLYEEYKLYQQILRYHISQKDMDSAMNCCRKFGAQEPHLWVEMLWCPPPSHHLPEVLNVIANQKLLSPLLVIDCLSNFDTFTLQDIRKYLVNILSVEENICFRETTQGELLRKETEKIQNELRDSTLKPLAFQTSRCAACSCPLTLPSRHFFCKHSYHQHCYLNFSESESECPACVPNNKALLEIIENQGTSAKKTEDFHDQLIKETDGFSVMAEYFKQGVFNKLTIITNENQDRNLVSIKNEPKIQNITTNTTRINKTENKSLPLTEARLRLEEGISKQLTLPTEGTKISTPKSSIISPAPEGRIRLMEQKHQDSQYIASLEANITRLPLPNFSLKQPITSIYNDRSSDRGNSEQNTPNKNSPASLKNKKLDNLSISSAASSHKEVKPLISKDSTNPFEDIYDESKNPFANEGSNPFEDDD